MKFLIFLTVATVLLVFSPCLAQNRVSFGETCNKTFRCDSKAALTCVNETCQCLKETEMIYDSTRAKCVVLAGERCQYTAIESDGEGRSWTEELDCVANGDCNHDGFCNCRIEFYENSVGQCVPRKNYNESCEKDDECSKLKMLVCVEGKCMCNVTEGIYDRYYGECARKVGVSTRGYKRCVSNTQDTCHPYYGCEEACVCLVGFKNSTDGRCLGSYDFPCDPILSPCEDHLTCNGGKCDCHFPQKQEYDSYSQKCISKVNGPCLETVRGNVFHYECNGEAECREDHGVHECLCKKGFIKSKDSTCKKTYGMDCTKHEECDAVPWAHLRCIEGICSCGGDFQVYDESSTRCLGLVGADCSMEQKCIENAHCKKQRPSISMMSLFGGGICRCKPGTKVDSNRKCIEGGESVTGHGQTVKVQSPVMETIDLLNEYSVEI